MSIHPTAYRLSVNTAWFTSNSNIKIDLFIRKLVNGVFLAFNYLSSHCLLIHKTHSLKIVLMVFDNSFQKSTRINYIIQLLKSILEIKLNKKIVFEIREIKNKSENAKILADWLAINLQKQPNKLKLIETLKPSLY